MSVEHLRPRVTDRGFMHLPPIVAVHGGRPAGTVRVYESSAAGDPAVWIAVEQPADRNHPENGLTREAVVHMPLDRAVQFAEQIMWLASNHFKEAHYEAGEGDA